MARTLILAVEVTVADDADDLTVADWLFETLLESDPDDAIESFDSVQPRRL